MKEPVFALEGIDGVYNYGCEAIVRGTVRILKSGWPDCRILYASRRPAEDRKALEDVNLEFVGTSANISFAKRLVNKGLRVTGVPFRMRVRRYYDWLEDVDCVLSIGGDMFTLSPEAESAREFAAPERARHIMDSGKPLVLWGASVGPFEANPRAVRVYSEVLKRMSLIAARGRLTVDYLAQLGIVRSVRLVADPAFVMDADDSASAEYGEAGGSRRVLGVNLSPLSVHFVDERKGRRSIPETQADVLVRLLEDRDIDILLIPHVICPWREVDDDYGYLRDIQTRIGDRFGSRVRLLPPDMGAPRTKGIISRCHALVAARMHCAIAGLSTGVPTLLLSYSRKALGMSDYVYGDQDRVLPVRAGGERLLNAVRGLFADAERLRRHLIGRNEAIRRDAMAAGRFLKEVLS